MKGAWEEAVDLDESDFPSLLRRCNRPLSIPANHTLSPHAQQNSQTLVPSQTRPKRPRFHAQSILSQPEIPAASQRSPVVDVLHPRSIPGPAGTVLAALLRRRSQIRDTDSEEDMTMVSTQEYLRKAVDGSGVNSEFDDDFKKPTWVAALDFSERENTELTTCTAVPLGTIRNSGTPKLSKVVAMIKSLTPNGFGDFMVTLKDPSGMISASIHRSVVTEGNYGCYLTVGAVLVLRMASVFSPRAECYLNITHNNVVKASVFSPRAECYLNITHNNVVKIFPKYFESASNSVAGLAAVVDGRGTQLTNSGTGNEDSGTISNFGRQSMSEPIHGNNSTKDVATKSTQSIEKRNECKGDTTVFNSSADINNRAQAALMDGNYSYVLHHEQPGDANKMIHKAPAIAESNGTNRQMQLLTSLSSLPQWTDEQLEELLVED